jgi:hypothetical protein
MSKPLERQQSPDELSLGPDLLRRPAPDKECDPVEGKCQQGCVAVTYFSEQLRLDPITFCEGALKNEFPKTVQVVSRHEGHLASGAVESFNAPGIVFKPSPHLRPSQGHEIVALGLLIAGPFRNGLLLVGFGASAKIRGSEKVDRRDGLSAGIHQGALFHGKVPASVGAIGINPASVGGYKGTSACLLVVHAQQHLGKVVTRPHDHIRVGINKVFRGHVKTLSEAQQIIRVQQEVQISTALVEACDLGVASEMKGLPGSDPASGQLVHLSRVKIFHNSTVRISATVNLIF